MAAPDSYPSFSSLSEVSTPFRSSGPPRVSHTSTTYSNPAHVAPLHLDTSDISALRTLDAYDARLRVHAALSLSIRTSPNSTAFVNITVSTSNPVVSISARLNSSVQPLEVIGLTEDRITTLALTFDESPERTVLDIDSIIVTFSDNKCVTLP